MSPIFQRLTNLRLVSGKTWQEVAADLGLSRSMLFRVKSGSRNLSEKALFRLSQAEAAAGIHGQARALLETGTSPEQLVTTLLDQPPNEGHLVTLEDIDRGHMEVPVSYRRGSPPPGRPTSIRVRAAANEDLLRKGLGTDARLHRQNPGPLLTLCLPKELALPEFLNHLTPGSYRDLVEVCIALTFGTSSPPEKPEVDSAHN